MFLLRVRSRGQVGPNGTFGEDAGLALNKREATKNLRSKRPGTPKPVMPVHGAVGALGHIFVFALVLLIAVGAVGGMAYVRLAHGPISLKFLTPYIEKGINAELAGLTARMDEALLAVSDDGILEFRLSNLRLTQPDGDVVATIPLAAVELSRSALWSLQLVPARIDLIGAKLSLTYTEAAGLTMNFVTGNEAAARDLTAPLSSQASTNPAAAPQPASPGNIEAMNQRRFDLGGMIADATAKARDRLKGASFLNQIGVRDGSIALDNLGVRSQWRVTEGVVDLLHGDVGSAVSAKATIASERGPWTLTLRSEATDNGGAVQLAATIRGLVPRTLGLAIPQLSLLETLDAPINADSMLTLAGDGKVLTGNLGIAIGRGQFLLPAVGDVPFAMDNGQIGLTYDGKLRRFELSQSMLSWGNSRVGLVGSAVGDTSDTNRGWTIDLATAGGQLTAEEFGVPPVAIENGVLKGRLLPGAGDVVVTQLSFKAGGTMFSSSGQFLTGAAPGAGGAKFDATIGPTTADTLKALWPRALASGGRTWVGERIKRGTVKSGVLHFVSGTFAQRGSLPLQDQKPGTVPAQDGTLRRLTIAMEAADITAQPLRWLSPVEAPRALIRLENQAIEITVPDANIVISPTRKVPIKLGRFASANLESDPPDAEITFKTLGPLVPVLDVLDQSPLRLLRSNGLTTDGIDGKVDGQVKLTFPLISDLDAKVVKIEAKARVVDGRAKQLAGLFDVHGATIAVDVTDAAVGVSGDLLANGVPVKLGWQRILEENSEKQPPLRLSATLDNADRNQLGIDINHIVQGEVPVEILIEKGQADEASVRMRANLTNADISLDAIAWRKLPGKTVSLGADVVKGKTHKFELQNLRVVGDDVAIEGMIGIGADNRLREVNLSSFSLNVITHLDIQALLKPDAGGDKAGVWQVKVRGQNFDGRDLFRSLFSVGPAGPEKTAKSAKPSAGMDIDAEIDNVIGHTEVSLRGLKVKMSRRAEKMVSMDARGTLDGGAPLIVSMTPEAGQPRRLLADTTDAGQAFKLIGFYPNMQVGRARIELNVDGRGPAEKTGIVWVEDFKILGDPVVSEVLGSAPEASDDAKAVRRSKKAAQREVFEFDRMKVPFSVGYGQFVIENAYLRGPLLGVNLVGKADFKLRSLNLGGTYIPLQGINNAFGEVPILGALVSGPKGDGAFGITFAVQGSMSQPQVLVNPLSIVAPGIFREMFQMTNPNPKVIPRDEKAPSAPVEKRVRASSSPGGAVQAPNTTPTPTDKAGNVGAVDGWASEASPSKGVKK